MNQGPPFKRYLKIGEVSRLTSLNSSVLRFWETEFDMLRPQKSRTGQRLYSEADLELVFRIKKLLYDEKLTIAGARGRLSRPGRKSGVGSEGEDSADSALRILEEVRRELADLRDSL